MKKIVMLLIIVVITIMSISCNNNKSVMEKVLVECLKSPSSYKCISFEKGTVVTLDDELIDRITYFSEIMELDSTQVSYYEKEMSFYNKMNKKYGGYTESLELYKKNYYDYKNKVKRDSTIVEYLTNIKSTIKNVSQTTFVEYNLIYDATNSFGATLRDTCTGRFNSKGELVAIKISEDSNWELIGEFFSIPNYYEIIK